VTTSAPAVLVVDDERASVELLRVVLGEHWPVHTALDGEQALAVLAGQPDVAVAIIDQRMPGMTGTELIRRTIEPYPHLVRIILTGYTDTQALIDAINAGRVFRYLTKPWGTSELVATVRQGMELHRLTLDNLRLQAELQAANARLRRENTHLRHDAHERARFAEMVGTGAAMQRLFDQLGPVVASDATVLILGETGTGKEMVARAIHYNGPRADRPFVSENCGAIAPDLLTSELFGHRRGAFTGAHEDRAGLFELAHGGTLFLDEIGDCPPDLQVRLLRVLDQGEIRRVGDSTPTPVDVRIVAATHRDLAADAASGRFRRDLYYRLCVFTLRTPPLRERREDVAMLAEHFAERLAARAGRNVPGFSAEALALLAAHDWPGNVRELQNEVERAFVLARAEEYITPDLLSDAVTRAAPPPTEDLGSLPAAVTRLETQLIRDTLARHAGNITHTATALGISRRGLLDKMQRYGLRDG